MVSLSDNESTSMFFHREKAKVLSFADQLERLRSLGYESAPVSGGFRIVRGNLAALLTEGSKGEPRIADVGLAVGSE